MRLENKKAIVTGGAGGIGRATSLALAAEGAAVAVVDLNAEAAEAVAQEIRAAGGTAIAIAADVASEPDIERVIATSLQELGGVNVVFNNAGIIRRTTAVETTVEEWDRVFGVNVRSIFLMCKHVVPIMEAAGGGSIINISSMAGENKNVHMASYGSSKAAENHLTRNIAFDLGPKGIRVNAIAPGATKTAALKSVLNPEIEKAMLKHTPLGRLGEPDDIAQAVAFLVGPSAAYITGETLHVNGGMYMP